MTTPITRILCGLDLSAGSANTLRYALGLARATGAELHLLHVCEALSEDAKITLMMFVQDEKARKAAIERRLRTSAQTFRDAIDAVVDSLGGDARALVTSSEVVEGFPAEIILGEAKRMDCDLIVLGAHEHGLNHTFIGTVAKRVMRRADIPTLIVPNR